MDDLLDPDGHIDVSELVLGHLDAHRRAAMAAHLSSCPVCRDEYDHLATTVSGLLPAVPAVQPSLGFDQRVLARMGVEPTAPSNRWRHTWVMAAAATIVVVLGVAGWWVIGRDSSTSSGTVAALELTNGGGQVGTVSVEDVHGETVMVVALIDAPEGVSYRCRTTFADGTVAESDPWPATYGAWIVPLPDSAGSSVDSVQLLVDDTDHVWSAASFD